MDALEFVQNIKKYCGIKGVKPTVACRESGVGTSFINNIEKRGSMPSVEKVQLLADYLGVTTSELLGEKIEPGTTAEPPSENERIFRSLPPELQEEALRYMRYLAHNALAQQQGQNKPAED